MNAATMYVEHPLRALLLFWTAAWLCLRYQVNLFRRSLTGNFGDIEMVGRDPSSRRRTDLPLPLNECSDYVCRASFEGFAAVLDSGLALPSISSEFVPAVGDLEFRRH